MRTFALLAFCILSFAFTASAAEPYAGIYEFGMRLSATNGQWEMAQSTRCHASADRCIAAQGRYRELVQAVQGSRNSILTANTMVNAAVRYVPELRGQDVWQSPFDTLVRGAGDCEDFVILKLHVLRDAGVQAEMGIIVFNNHGMLGVRRSGHAWELLDNGRSGSKTEGQAAAEFGAPHYFLSSAGLQSYRSVRPR